jgi:hypothetical protein
MIAVMIAFSLLMAPVQSRESCVSGDALVLSGEGQ